MTRRAICWPVTRPPLVREHRPPPLIGQRLLMLGPDWPRPLPGSAHCHAGQIGMNESWFEFGDKVTAATTKPNGNGKVNKWIYFLQCCFVTCSCKLAPREFLAAWKLVFNLTIFSSRYKEGRTPFILYWMTMGLVLCLQTDYYWFVLEQQWQMRG